jgi:positive phototaxis protein PixI
MVAAFEHSTSPDRHPQCYSQTLMEWLRQGQDKRLECSPLETGTPGSTRFIAQESEVYNQLIPQKFLRISLGVDDVALLPLSSVKEVLQVSMSGILPVPDMPESILGLYSSRSEMMWALDLGQQLGYSSPFLSPHLPMMMTAIALQAEDQVLAVIVSRVGNIEVHSLQELQPPSLDLFSAPLIPFMQGYLTTANNPVLDAKAIVQNLLSRIHTMH